MTPATVVIAQAHDQLQAGIWQTLLEAEGIPVEIQGGVVGGLYTGVSQIAAISIVVLREDAARARELIDAFESGKDAEDAP